MKNSYKNLIFTKHALERMNQRSISKDKIWQVINYPNKTYNLKDASKKYIKKISNRRYQIIASYLPNEKKYLVISTWVRGENDPQNIIWLIITAPFKLLWWLLKKLWQN